MAALGRVRRWAVNGWLQDGLRSQDDGVGALLIAFTFNLDQPQWALLTVFIVSQPQESGLVLAKSFYRIIGTLVGAAVALLLIALFAQERVLFLGAIALWVGLCTFGSQYARNIHRLRLRPVWLHRGDRGHSRRPRAICSAGAVIRYFADTN